MRALLPFTKYHGLGNDFILIDARELVFDPALSGLVVNWKAAISELAPFLCDRHHGIGADGVILALPLYGKTETEQFESQTRNRARKLSGEFALCQSSLGEGGSSDVLLNQYRNAIAPLVETYPQVESCQLSWVFTNSDGSNAVMCGNGLRCLALWANRRCGISQKSFKIATAKGPVSIEFDKQISVNVGPPVLTPALIPVKAECEPGKQLVKLSLPLGKRTDAYAVGMGNPHCVIFDESVWNGWSDAVHNNRLKEPAQLPGHLRETMAGLAVSIQNNPVFPEGVNVEFVQVVARNMVRAYVYERGCGFTLACASGAAAIVVAGVLCGQLERTTTVQLPGGKLEIHYDEASETISIKGKAEEVYSGLFKLGHFTQIELGSESKAEANCK